MFIVKLSLRGYLPEYLVRNEMLVFSLNISNAHPFKTLEEAKAHIARYGNGLPLSVVNLTDVAANE